MKKLLFGLLGLLVTISGWSAETNSGPISSVTVAGLVAQNGTPTPNTPVAINTNNGMLKISKNLFDQSTATRYRTSWSNSGDGAWQVVSETSQAVTYGSYVKPNTTYTLSKKGGARLIITGYRTKTEPSSSQPTPADYKIQTDTTEIVGGSYTFTTPADCTWILFGLRQNNATFTFPYDVQLEQGSTATEYKPYGEIYTDGEVETIGDSANHTATVATLLGVGDYKDEQNINTGAITRNIEVKVLDGTENWTYRDTQSGYATFQISNPFSYDLTGTPHIICSHFEDKGPVNGISVVYQMGVGIALLKSAEYPTGRNLYLNIPTSVATDITTLKQYLADQYAGGTPVIIVYPLATPTTESVTGQTMTTAPVNNRTGGVTGMTITTLLSSGASVVTTIATNAIKIATTAYNSARFSPVVTDLNSTIATIRDVVTNTINQTKAIADLQATKQTRPNENCPAGKKCLLVETEENGVIVPHWYEIIENTD